MDKETFESEYPKAKMLLDYMVKHYPDDYEELAKVKMISYILKDTEHTPEQLYENIDKIALFNSFTKWGPIKG